MAHAQHLQKKSQKKKKKRSIHLRTPLNKVEGDYAFIA